MLVLLIVIIIIVIIILIIIIVIILSAVDATRVSIVTETRIYMRFLSNNCIVLALGSF